MSAIRAAWDCRAEGSSITPLAEAFAQIGVSSTEAIVIRFVRANPGCTQSDIGRAIGVKRTNMVPVVSGLMHKGLLERTAADGRSQSLYLTRAAGDVLRKITRPRRITNSNSSATSPRI
jgi:DNA-binding MarR family transcriptional regulator